MFASNFVGVFRGRNIEPLNPKAKVGQMHVMSGSYNPLHEAHRWMFQAIDEEAMVVQKYGGRGYAIAATTSSKYFEISTARVGKEDLTSEELIKRLRQFSGFANVLVTTQPLFADKLEALRPYAEEIIFHIGFDNYERLVEINGLREVGEMRCSFCVWPRNGRSLVNGPKNCFDSGVDLPEHLRGMSSTQIREAAGR